MKTARLGPVPCVTRLGRQCGAPSVLAFFIFRYPEAVDLDIRWIAHTEFPAAKLGLFDMALSSLSDIFA